MIRAFQGRRMTAAFGKSWLFGGMLFLYLPMLTLIVYSFNKSPMPAVWGGFTLEFYGKLARDKELLGALWLSLKIAFWSATLSVVLGTLAAFTLVRYIRFSGRTFFTGMVNAPLVMPEVIQGLSLLLMLVALQSSFDFLKRGFLTILIGHVVLGLSYAAVVISARLQSLNPQLEEAAMDLGARPWGVFRLVTLPMIAQSLAAAWLLTFSLSLDDVVTSAFLSGPGATTLPLVIFSRARLGLNPSVNAVASVTILVVAICVTVASILVARAERRRTQEMNSASRDD